MNAVEKYLDSGCQ